MDCYRLRHFLSTNFIERLPEVSVENYKDPGSKIPKGSWEDMSFPVANLATSSCCWILLGSILILHSLFSITTNYRVERYFNVKFDDLRFCFRTKVVLYIVLYIRLQLVRRQSGEYIYYRITEKNFSLIFWCWSAMNFFLRITGLI